MVSQVWNKLRDARRRIASVRTFDVNRHRITSGPRGAQIQTVDRCNATCSMCPYAAPTDSQSANSMEPALYTSILEQLARTGSIRTIVPMLQNEPLLDRNLASRVREAKLVLGEQTRVVIVTNGSALTSNRVDELISAGIDSIGVSLDAFREETYTKIRHGLDFRRVVANIQAVLRRPDRPRLVVRFLRQHDNAGEEQNFIKFWKRQGAEVYTHAVLNRAGALENYQEIKAQPAPAHHRLVHGILNRLLPCCSVPFSTLTVLSDGRIIPCCHDWGPQMVLGNLSKESLEDAWNGEVANSIRHHLLTGEPERLPSCDGCSHAWGMWRAES